MDQYTADITQLLYNRLMNEPKQARSASSDLRAWCIENFGINEFDIRWSVANSGASPRRILVVYSAEHMILFKLRWAL